MLHSGFCGLCADEKTGVILNPEGFVCLDCVVFTYAEALAEEHQDNEMLNKKLGLTFP